MAKAKPLSSRERELLYQLSLIVNAMNIEKAVPKMAGFTDVVRRSNPIAAQVEKAFLFQQKKSMQDIEAEFARQKKGASHGK